jgi:hypothetical protein
MSSNTVDINLQVPFGKANIMEVDIENIIKEVEIVSEVKSGLTMKQRKPVKTRGGIPPEVITIIISVSIVFINAFVKKYAEKLAEEAAKDSAPVIRDAEKYFLIWLKKKIEENRST